MTASATILLPSKDAGRATDDDNDDDEDETLAGMLERHRKQMRPKSRKRQGRGRRLGLGLGMRSSRRRRPPPPTDAFAARREPFKIPKIAPAAARVPVESKLPAGDPVRAKVALEEFSNAAFSAPSGPSVASTPEPPVVQTTQPPVGRPARGRPWLPVMVLAGGGPRRCCR